MRTLRWVKIREPVRVPLDDVDTETLIDQFRATQGLPAQAELIAFWVVRPEFEAKLSMNVVLDGVFGADFATVDAKDREFLFAAVFVCWGDIIPEELIQSHRGFLSWVSGFGKLGTRRSGKAVEPFWACARSRGFRWAVALVFAFPVFLREGLVAPALVLDFGVDLSEWQLEQLALCLGRTRSPDADEFEELVARLSSFEWRPQDGQFKDILKGIRLRGESAKGALVELLAERGVTVQFS